MNLILEEVINHISDVLNERINNYQPISGGDISQAFLLETSNNRYFLKVNSGANALAMFQAEQKGLETIAATKTISTPNVFYTGILDATAFLLLEYIESKSASSQDFEQLGHELASLHQITYTQFGLGTPNFIGSLPQQNNFHNNWTSFYIEERLEPQFELALSKNLLLLSEIPKKKEMTKVLEKLFVDVKPSLIHGDLWSGNFLIGIDGKPYLIDPAIYYGHNEIDIAMSKLFGGFGTSFYNAYHEIFPKTSETSARIDIYQLYYLLVHLNLFGNSYKGSVKRILGRYFQIS